jgi:hypothetical protein
VRCVRGRRRRGRASRARHGAPRCAARRHPTPRPPTPHHAAPGITAAPAEDNLRYFAVTIEGPAQSPYEGGLYKLELFLPEDYPMAAPKV